MLRPLDDRLLVEPIPDALVTASGIIVPHETTTFTKEDRALAVTRGRVVAVGPGRWHKKRRIPVDAKPGDLIRFSDTCGWRGEIEGQGYIVLREDDISHFEE